LKFKITINQMNPGGYEAGCPPGQEFVSCANQCPQRCSDLQQGIECQDSAECQPGCRCPTGTRARCVHTKAFGST
uniref:TIL domain-containing protein n=1 Tax=Salarias fasciatus TaxID=181472 RepID=A0A672FUL3_SALFA